MAPRPIDDSVTLLEIAVEKIHDPKAKFAALFRAATARVPAYQHSDDSARRRLQRKFKKEEPHWIELGHCEIAKRRSEKTDQFHRDMTRIAQQMRPISEAFNEVIKPYIPIMASLEVQWNSPAMRQLLKQVELLGNHTVPLFSSVR